jgi:hypothetical protein
MGLSYPSKRNLPNSERKALYKKLKNDTTNSDDIQELWNSAPELYRNKQMNVLFFLHPNTPEHIVNQIDIMDIIKGDLDLTEMFSTIIKSNATAQKTILKKASEFNENLKQCLQDKKVTRISFIPLGANFERSKNFIVINLLASENISPSEWFDFLQTKSYVDEYMISAVCNRFTELLKNSKAKQDFTTHVKEVYGLNVENYSVDMIVALLGEENNFKLI